MPTSSGVVLEIDCIRRYNEETRKNVSPHKRTQKSSTEGRQIPMYVNTTMHSIRWREVSRRELQQKTHNCTTWT